MKQRAVLVFVAVGFACSPPTSEPDSGRAATDVFVRAVDGVPGGTFLGVFVPPPGQVDVTNATAGRYDRVAYLARGFVGVDPTTITAPFSAGGLAGYAGDGSFDTLCTFDHPLRALLGVDGVVLGVGDAGLVVRYTPATHACTTTTVMALDGGMVDFRGIATNGSTIIAVGSSSHDGVHAPYALRLDGAMPVAETLPSSPATQLTSISWDPVVGFWTVGDHGTSLQRGAMSTSWVLDTTANDDSMLTAVSTESVSNRRWTMTVGGGNSTLVLARNFMQTEWQNRHDFPSLDGVLRGVYTRADFEVYEVGTAGLNVVYNGRDYYIPPGERLTTLDLLAVHGAGGIVVAAGGEPSNTTLTQKGVVLIRGELVRRTAFSFDGVSYPAVGNTRLEFGLGAGSVQ